MFQGPLNLRKAFTLLELLIAIGIIGILTAIVLVAINPTKQLQDARGANRNVSVREIENAINQYIIDLNTLSGIPSGKANAQDICRPGGAGCYDLSVLTPTYLASIPIDPDETDVNLSGYRIYLLGTFIKVCAPR